MRPPVIGDLVRDRQRLEIYCAGPRCPRGGAPVVLDPEDAVKLLGPQTTFVEARERLRCRECGASGPKNITARASMVDYYANLKAAGMTIPPAHFESGKLKP